MNAPKATDYVTRDLYGSAIAFQTAYRALFSAAALTGARLGELLGLQWKHIDLDQRTLRIEQSLWQRQLVPPKTPGSIRTIYFGDSLGAVLAEHSQKAAHIRPDDFVFCKSDGIPHHPDVLRKDVLSSKCRQFGIPHVSAFCSNFYQRADRQLKTCAKAVGAFDDRYDGECLHTHIYRSRTRGSKGRGTGDLRRFVPQTVPNWEQI